MNKSDENGHSYDPAGESAGNKAGGMPGSSAAETASPGHSGNLDGFDVGPLNGQLALAPAIAGVAWGAAILGAFVWGTNETRKDIENRGRNNVDDGIFESRIPGSYSAVRAENRAAARAASRANNLDSHHVALDQEVNTLAGYNRSRAPAVSLTKEQHAAATAAQRGYKAPENPTLKDAFGRARAGLNAAVAAGLSPETANAKMEATLGYFTVELGHSLNTPVNSLGRGWR